MKFYIIFWLIALVNIDWIQNRFEFSFFFFRLVSKRIRRETWWNGWHCRTIGHDGRTSHRNDDIWSDKSFEYFYAVEQKIHFGSVTRTACIGRIDGSTIDNANRWRWTRISLIKRLELFLTRTTLFLKIILKNLFDINRRHTTNVQRYRHRW